MSRTINLWIILYLAILICPSTVNASAEKQRLLNSKNFIFVDLPGKYKEIKIVRKDSFKVGPDVAFTTGNVKTIIVDYDKKWTIEDTRAFSDYEVKNKYKGQLDIHEVYWKENKVQAYIVKRFYPALGTHNVTDIYDRQYLLNNI